MKTLKHISRFALAGYLAMSSGAFAQQKPKRTEADEPQRSQRVSPPPRQNAERPPERQSPPPERQGQPPERQSPQPSNDRSTERQQNPGRPSIGIYPQGPPPDMKQRRGRDQEMPGGRHGNSPRAGDWLRQYKDVPVNEQEKALTSDPNFQRLPGDRQEKLRDRLRQFNSLSPEMKDRLLDRMAKYESMTPQERERLQRIQEGMRHLPDDRRKKVRQGFRKIKGLPADQRERFMNSEGFRNEFTDEEREMIKGLTEIEDTPDGEPPNDE
ncbi:MAG TPA: DUF3106 domain-containing protein [Terriglobales bacterium]|nr:DUF3106 domain-containing protein [Terriglobales bacterium]